MQPTMNDPILGQLRFDVFWEGAVGSTRLGDNVRLRVDTSEQPWLPNPGHPPSEAQRQAYTQFLGNEQGLLARVEQAIFDHYNRVKDHYREAGSHWTVEQVPDLQHNSQIWGLLSAPLIEIPPQEPSRSRITLAWNCSWDPEHGIRVSIENGEVIDVE